MKLELIEKREVTRIIDGEEDRQLENSSYRILNGSNSEVGHANIGHSYFMLSMYNKTVTTQELTEIINNL